MDFEEGAGAPVPWSAGKMLQRGLARSDAQGPNIASLVSDVVRTGFAGLLMSMPRGRQRNIK